MTMTVVFKSIDWLNLELVGGVFPQPLLDIFYPSNLTRIIPNIIVCHTIAKLALPSEALVCVFHLVVSKKDLILKKKRYYDHVDLNTVTFC